MKLVLGCYDPNPHPYHNRWIDQSWTLSDIEPRADHIVKVDARNIQFHKLEAIYASHLLEHIAIEEVDTVLAHWKSRLAPGGQITINVPDMEWLATEILNGERHGLFTSDYFGSIQKLMYVIYGPGEGYDQHKSGFTKGLLYEKMMKAGFEEIVIDREYDDGHDMGILLATAWKK